MSVVMRSLSIETVQFASARAGKARALAQPVVDDAYRFQSIGSLQALALAAAAAILTTGLLWVVL